MDPDADPAETMTSCFATVAVEQLKVYNKQTEKSKIIARFPVNYTVHLHYPMKRDENTKIIWMRCPCVDRDTANVRQGWVQVYNGKLDQRLVTSFRMVP